MVSSESLAIVKSDFVGNVSIQAVDGQKVVQAGNVLIEVQI